MAEYLTETTSAAGGVLLVRLFDQSPQPFNMWLLDARGALSTAHGNRITPTSHGAGYTDVMCIGEAPTLDINPA